MKKIFLLAFVMLTIVGVQAQEKGKIRVGLDAGLALPRLGAGIDGALDVRYNIMDNVNLGVRLGSAYMIRDFLVSNDGLSAEVTMHLNTNFLVSGDYYFNKGTSIFAPFLGAGLGSFEIYDFYMVADASNPEYVLPTRPQSDTKFGGVLRGGFELGKFRMGLEYYIIPQSRLYDVTTLNYSGFSQNSYLNLSIGFYLGGGKWKKPVDVNY